MYVCKYVCMFTVVFTLVDSQECCIFLIPLLKMPSFSFPAPFSQVLEMLGSF